MNISVIIATYNRPDDLADCVQSLENQFDPPSEIIVVDDGSYDQNKKILDTENKEKIVHVEGSQEGLGSARNMGIEVANGEIIAFVDDDVILPPNWTQELKRAYEEFPEAAGIGGHVLNYTPTEINKARIDSFGYRLLQGFRQVFFQHKLGKVSPVGILWAPHTLRTGGPRKVEVLQGCNMSFRSEVAKAYTFDDWYGTSGSAAAEEIDFGAKVSADGQTIIYHPRIVAIHRRTLNTESGARSGGPNYGNVTNLSYFLLNHPEKSAGNVLLLALFIGVYSLLKRDPGYLRGLLTGVSEFYTDNGD